MPWSQEAELSNTVTSKTKCYPSPCPPPHAPVPPDPPTAWSQRQPLCDTARARECVPAAAHGRRVGPRFPPSAKIYIEPQINFIIFSSLIMPTSAARPKLCTCILIHPSPSSLSALNFSVIIVRRRAPFCGREKRRLAVSRSMQSEAQAALGRQGPCLDCRQLSGPQLVAAPCWAQGTCSAPGMLAPRARPAMAGGTLLAPGPGKVPCPRIPWSCFHPGSSHHTSPRCATGSEFFSAPSCPACNRTGVLGASPGSPCSAFSVPSPGLVPVTKGSERRKWCGIPLLSPTACLLPLREMFHSLTGRCKGSFSCKAIKT